MVLRSATDQREETTPAAPAWSNPVGRLITSSGRFGAGDAGLAGGEDGEAQALELEVEQIAQGEDFVVGH
jgi:hypothetical protein